MGRYPDRSIAFVAVAAAALLSGCGSGASNPVASPLTEPQAAASLDTADAPLGALLAHARAATARYQDVSVALRDGFFQASPCIAGPAGAMGFHYLNPARLDATAAAEELEILLYVPEGGRLRLAGVEYMVPVFQDGRPLFGPVPPASPGAAPVLFNTRFAGPMPGHAPRDPWHYDLHVWLWSRNPAGTFAPFNPALSCS
jgi:hypothetical protein